MPRVLWPLALVVAFLIGWAAAGLRHGGPGTAPGGERGEDTVSRLQQQVTTLQARLHAREDLAAARPSSGSAPAVSSDRAAASERSTSRLLTASLTERRPTPERRASPTDVVPFSADRGASPKPAGPTTVQAALDRFYKYLETTNGAEGRERWQQARALVDDLRAMGDVGAQALMQVLASGTDSDERRAAARLLGTLQVPQSLPLLKDIIEQDSDLLLRRTAAQALRQLQTPESIPLMERLLANPAEDRFVRLSAAYGLAESGQPLGVSGLTQIFAESTADGRGREMAFRALAALADDRALPFMRQLVGSQLEPAYRLRAIRFLTMQGDQQSLGLLHLVMQSPVEQPSIRDAAAQAYRVLGGK